MTHAQVQILLDCVHAYIDGVRAGTITDYALPIDKELAALIAARDFLLSIEVSE